MNSIIQSDVLITDEFMVTYERKGRKTICRIAPPVHQVTPLATGSAVRNPDDPECEPVGQAIAFSRALAELSRKYNNLGVTLDAANNFDRILAEEQKAINDALGQLTDQLADLNRIFDKVEA